MSKPEIRIRVLPRYLPDQSSPLEEVYGFAYTIAITNKGDAAAQLISRRWIIVDADGHQEEVRGLGVVGHQPLLQPGESFEYTSGCRLRTPTGSITKKQSHQRMNHAAAARSGSMSVSDPSGFPSVQ